MNNLKASEEFVIGKHSIGYVSDDFKKYFGTDEFAQGTMPTFRKLEKSMSDASIESELMPGICTLADILAFMDSAPEECKDGYANIFYTPSCVVFVYWFSFYGGWIVYAWYRDEDGWFAGYRVFSPATSTQSSVGIEGSLISILQKYCGERGDSEGAVETLERIVRERDILLRNAIKEVLKLV